MKRTFHVWVVVAAALALTPAAGAEPTSKNASVVRTLTGSYIYRALSDGRETGRETFTMTVHPDGTRVMRAATDLYSRGVQANVTLRAAPDFRPIEAQLMMYRGGEFRGSSVIHVAGDSLTVTGRGPDGVVTERHAVPDRFSLATHPLALDGWSSWYVDPAKKGPQPGVLFVVVNETRPDLIVRVERQDETFQVIGREQVTVPAGTFTADRIVMGEHEVWVSGPDRLLVRYVWKKIDREYLLAKVAIDPPPQ